MRKIILAIITAIFTLGFSAKKAFTQNEGDALRYGRYYFTGTARYAAMGGAFGAFGADVSNLAHNPAGLGVFRKSQVTLTPGVSINRTRSTHYDETNVDSRTSFNLANLGLVFSSKIGRNKRPTDGFQYVNFGMAYTKTSDLNNRTLIRGTNEESSLLDDFANSVNANGGFATNAYYDQLAMNAELLIPSPSGGYYAFDAPWPNAGKIQRKDIESRGSMGDVSFAIAANYANTLYFGASFNINVLDYRQTSFHSEQDAGDSIPEFKEFVFKEYFRTRGSGINAKFGLIYRPVDFLRLGISFHTPTAFTLTDRFENDMNATFDNGVQTEALSPAGVFKYRYSNPLRLQISAGFVIGKLALLGLEYEFVNYKGPRFRETGVSTNFFQTTNERIKQVYRGGHNVKAGAELKLDPFAFRVGAHYASSPYQVTVNNSPAWGMSAGVGFQNLPSGFFLDIAYSLFSVKEAYWLYDASLVRATQTRMQKHNLLLTAGFNF